MCGCPDENEIEKDKEMWYGKTEAKQEICNADVSLRSRNEYNKKSLYDDENDFQDKEFMLKAINCKVSDYIIEKHKNLELPSLKAKESPYEPVDFAEEFKLSEECKKTFKNKFNINHEYEKDLKNVNYEFKPLTKEQEKKILDYEAKMAAIRPKLEHPVPDNVNLETLQKKYYECLDKEKKSELKKELKKELNDLFKSENKFKSKIEKLNEKEPCKMIVMLYVDVGILSSEAAVEFVEKVSGLFDNVKARLPKYAEFVAIPCRGSNTRLEICQLGEING